MNNPEKEWLLRAQQGDAEAFSNIVAAYQVKVHNLCYRMLGDGYEAEDAAQETFLRAFRAIKRYDPDRPFSTWLLTIASRYCIDQLRKRRLQTFSIDPFLDSGLPDQSLTPEATLSRSEDQQQVQAILECLKPMDKSAIVMRYWYGYSYEEIAEALSITINAVKSRLHRARKELALQWVEEGTPNAMNKFVPERKRYESPAF